MQPLPETLPRCSMGIYTGQRFRGPDGSARASISPLPQGEGLVHQRLAAVLIHPRCPDTFGNRCGKLCRYLCRCGKAGLRAACAA